MAYAGNHFFKRAQLRRRGWSNCMISLFMSVPDGTMPTDYPGARFKTFRIFRRERVKTIEATPEFQQAIGERLARRKALHCRARTPLELLIAGITVPAIPWVRLVDLTCRNYNEWAKDHPSLWKRTISPDSSAALLPRIVVNYLRHNMTDYDEIIRENVRRIGIHVYPLIKRTVIEQIASKYPRLVVECRRQLCMMDNASQAPSSSRDAFKYYGQ
jgi:hypothetical protein